MAKYDSNCRACQVGELHIIHDYASTNTPLCVDERGCPDEGTCSRLLVCPRRVRAKADIWGPGQREIYERWREESRERTLIERQEDWNEEVRGWSGL